MNDIAMEIDGQEVGVPEVAERKINALQRQLMERDRLLEEVWGVCALWTELQLSEQDRKKALAAFLHIDSKLRGLGLKRFPAKFK